MDQPAHSVGKISWGLKVALLYTGFVAMIISLVIATFYRKSELVTKDYYRQETQFQQRLEAARAAANLPQPVRVTAGNKNICICFPDIQKGRIREAVLHFYAPSRASADRSFTVPVAGNKATIDRKELEAARYQLQISWQCQGQRYYQSVPLELMQS